MSEVKTPSDELVIDALDKAYRTLNELRDEGGRSCAEAMVKKGEADSRPWGTLRNFNSTISTEVEEHDKKYVIHVRVHVEVEPVTTFYR